MDLGVCVCVCVCDVSNFSNKVDKVVLLKVLLYIWIFPVTLFMNFILF